MQSFTLLQPSTGGKNLSNNNVTCTRPAFHPGTDASVIMDDCHRSLYGEFTKRQVQPGQFRQRAGEAVKGVNDLVLGIETGNRITAKDISYRG